MENGSKASVGGLRRTDGDGGEQRAAATDEDDLPVALGSVRCTVPLYRCTALYNAYER